MTVLAVNGRDTTGLVDEGRREWQRWLICGVIVVAAHVAIAAALLYSREVDDDDDFPSKGIVIDLAPMPFDPTVVPVQEVPPGPEQSAAEVAPETPPETSEDKTEEMVRAPDPEVALTAEPPKPETPAESQPPAPATTAPQMPTQVKSNAIPTWKRQISLLLERNKRYPAAAERHREVGVAQLAFTIDRQGRVTASRIVKSSGSAALDNEAMDLIKRVEPFPKPPPELGSDRVEFSVPISFTDRRAR